MKILGKKITKRTAAIFIITSFLSSLIGAIFFGEQTQEFVKEFFIGKPNIDINLITLKRANITQTSKDFQNFTLMYAGGLGYSQLLLIQNKNASNNVLSNTFEQRDCELCTFYNFILRNNGNLVADSIILDLTSSEEIRIIKDNQKVVEEKCGGSFYSKGCHFKIENLLKDEEIIISLESTQPTDLKINCKANNKEDYCNIRYVDIFTQNVPENSTFLMNNNIIEMPYIKNNDKSNLFYFYPPNGTWIPIESQSEMITENPNQTP